MASEKVLLFFLSLQLHCEFLPFPAVLLAVLVFGWGIRRVCRWPIKRCAVPLHSRLSLSYKQTNNVKINFTTLHVNLHSGTILTKVCNKKFMENRIEMLYNMTRRPIIWPLYLVCSCLPVINCGVVISSSSPEPNC